MLGCSYPNLDDWKHYLNKFPPHAAEPSLSFTTQKRFQKVGVAVPGAWNPVGPGTYRLPTTFVLNPRREVDATKTSAPKLKGGQWSTVGHTWDHEKVVDLGPGQYNNPINYFRTKEHKPKLHTLAYGVDYSFARTKKFFSGTRNRYATNVPGPGYYKLRGGFDNEDSIMAETRLLRQAARGVRFVFIKTMIQLA